MTIPPSDLHHFLHSPLKGSWGDMDPDEKVSCPEDETTSTEGSSSTTPSSLMTGEEETGELVLQLQQELENEKAKNQQLLDAQRGFQAAIEGFKEEIQRLQAQQYQQHIALRDFYGINSEELRREVEELRSEKQRLERQCASLRQSQGSEERVMNILQEHGKLRGEVVKLRREKQDYGEKLTSALREQGTLRIQVRELQAEVQKLSQEK